MNIENCRCVERTKYDDWYEATDHVLKKASEKIIASWEEKFGKIAKKYGLKLEAYFDTSYTGEIVCSFLIEFKRKIFPKLFFFKQCVYNEQITPKSIFSNIAENIRHNRIRISVRSKNGYDVLVNSSDELLETVIPRKLEIRKDSFSSEEDTESFDNNYFGLWASVGISLFAMIPLLGIFSSCFGYFSSTITHILSIIPLVLLLTVIVIFLTAIFVLIKGSIVVKVIKKNQLA